MIKAYLCTILSMYEGEDLEVRFSVYEDDTPLFKEMILLDYKKPVISGQYSLIALLKRLYEYRSMEVVVYVNDPALSEFVRGVNRTKNKDMLRMARKTKELLDEFNYISVVDVSGNKKMLPIWKKEIEEI